MYKYKTSILYNFICPHRHTFFTLKIIIFCKRTYDFEGAIKINSYIIQNNLHVYNIHTMCNINNNASVYTTIYYSKCHVQKVKIKQIYNKYNY